MLRLLVALVGVLEGLTDHFLLLDSAVELAGMNKVELLFKDPFFIGVIYYKGQIGRYTDLR